MSTEPIRLKAVACPYGSLNHRGHAQATIPFFDSPKRRVGATFSAHALKDGKNPLKDHGHGHYVVSEEPVDLICENAADPAYAYYWRAFADGDLLAADEATAKQLAIVDVGPDGKSALRKYEPPATVLARRKAQAIANWKAAHGGKDPDLAPTIKAHLNKDAQEVADELAAKAKAKADESSAEAAVTKAKAALVALEGSSVAPAHETAEPPASPPNETVHAVEEH